MQINSNHYVPRFLLKGWAIKESPNAVLVCDLISNKVEERPIDEVCCHPTPKELNDFWNDDVDQKVHRCIESFRQQPVRRFVSGICIRTRVGSRGQSDEARLGLPDDRAPSAEHPERAPYAGTPTSTNR
jgi:hypothetical protein